MKASLPNFVVRLALGSFGPFQVQFYLKCRKLLNSRQYNWLGLTVKGGVKFTGLILACQILRFRICEYLPGDTVFSRIVKRSMFLSFCSSTFKSASGCVDLKYSTLFQKISKEIATHVAFCALIPPAPRKQRGNRKNSSCVLFSDWLVLPETSYAFNNNAPIEFKVSKY